jgi:hypothetical protein
LEDCISRFFYGYDGIFFVVVVFSTRSPKNSLQGISNHFAPVTTSTSTIGSGDVLGGKVVTEEGASQSSTAQHEYTVV